MRTSEFNGWFVCFSASPRFVPAAEAGSPEREEEEKEEEVSRVDDRRLRRLRERQVSGHTRRWGPLAVPSRTPSHTHHHTRAHTSSELPLKFLVEML